MKIQICAENFGIDKDIDPIIEETRQFDYEEEFQRQIKEEEERNTQEKEEETTKVEVKEEEETSIEQPKVDIVEDTKELKTKTSIAQFDYEGSEGALSMKAGEKFEVVEEKDGWTSVINATTKISGWVPSNYLEEQ